MLKCIAFGALVAAALAAPASAQMSPLPVPMWKISNWEPAPEASPSAAPSAEPAAFSLEAAPPPPAEPEPAKTGDNYGPEAGEFEFTLGGSGSNDNDFDNGSFGFNAGLGFFLADSLELGLRQTVQYSDFGESAWIGFTRVALDFHFEIGMFVPFIGVNVGYVYGDNVNETFEAAPEVGVKVYVLEKTFIYGLAEYQFFFEDSDDADDSFDDGQFVYTLGIGFNFL